MSRFFCFTALTGTSLALPLAARDLRPRLELSDVRLYRRERPVLDLARALVCRDDDAGARRRHIHDLEPRRDRAPPAKSRFPLPSTTGNVHTWNSSTRSFRRSVWMRSPLPCTWISGPDCFFSSDTYIGTSPLMSVE